MYKLYVFLRSDLESLTPGKAAAQVAHAATSHALCYATDKDQSFVEWCGDEGRDFGTTVVLDGGSFEGYDFVNPNVSFRQNHIDMTMHMITDTSYPLRDGKVTHELCLHTCYWCFIDPDQLTETQSIALKSYKLYNGNHD